MKESVDELIEYYKNLMGEIYLRFIAIIKAHKIRPLTDDELVTLKGFSRQWQLLECKLCKKMIIVSKDFIQERQNEKEYLAATDVTTLQTAILTISALQCQIFEIVEEAEGRQLQ